MTTNVILVIYLMLSASVTGVLLARMILRHIDRMEQARQARVHAAILRIMTEAQEG